MAAGSILLPNTDYLPAQTFTQDGHTTKAQEIVLCKEDGTIFGSASAPIRTDPTGTTTQPVSDASGSLTIDAPVGTPVFTRLSDGSAALVGQKTMATSLPVTVASDQATFPVTTGGLTDTQLRASAVPVSGTVTASGPLTDTQLRASAVSVEQATSVDTLPGQATVTTGSITSGSDPNDHVAAACTGYPTTVIATSGTFNFTVGAFEGSSDGGTTYPHQLTAFVADSATSTVEGTTVSGSVSMASGGVNLYIVNTAGMTNVQLRASLYSSGTASVRIMPAAVPQTASTSLAGVVPQPQNAADGLTNTSIKGLPVMSETLLFNGTTWDRIRGDTTNGLDVDVTRLPALAAGTNNIGDVDVATMPKAATSTVTNVAANASSVTLHASNANRLGLYITNAGTSDLFVKLGATATKTTDYTAKLAPGAFWELPDNPIYTGVVDGIWTATGGNGALITELTA